MYTYVHVYPVYHQIFEVHNFHGSCNLKRFAETISRIKEILLPTPFTYAFSRRLIFAVPDQSAKNTKIMHLENLALYGILCSSAVNVVVHKLVLPREWTVRTAACVEWLP